ncbi:hypothetical protein KP79_PYT02573 [Mizuhopecten yessoensis]|uniref:Uncharacterized protein n=1 Tax=Mizuhopecten yessoensis TaxID=6573 RepID=A0A210PKE1_MIZYE|nr:hypothetical protein KP79_PYT02573 [Mizuhopecten yessoensis]
MKERFSDKDVPVVASRELNFTKEEESESLVEFAQRIQTISGDGFAHADTTTRNQITTETFLQGCREKMVAHRAMERNP